MARTATMAMTTATTNHNKRGSSGRSASGGVGREKGSAVWEKIKMNGKIQVFVININLYDVLQEGGGAKSAHD